MKHKINIADAVTASRIVFAVSVLLFPAFSLPFYVLYTLGAFTDMIDGMIARKLRLKSSFGAKLDTVADFVFVIAVMAKVFPTLDIPIWLWIWIAVIAFIKLANSVSGFVRLHKTVAVHTVTNKVTGFILFLLPFAVDSFSWQASVVASVVVCFTATLAAVQEGYLILIGKDIE